MAKFAGLRDQVTLDFEGSTIAYCVDAFCISMGALLGTSPVTAFVESATGISGAVPFFFSLMFSHWLTLYTILRGWKDGYHGDDGGTGVFCFYIFCTDLFVDSALGYWGCVGHRGSFDDSEVSFFFPHIIFVRAVREMMCTHPPSFS